MDEVEQWAMPARAPDARPRDGAAGHAAAVPMNGPCPECRARGLTLQRIGSRRFKCPTCNRFAAKSTRLTGVALAKKYPAEYRSIKTEVEREMYADMMAGL